MRRRARAAAAVLALGLALAPAAGRASPGGDGPGANVPGAGAPAPFGAAAAPGAAGMAPSPGSPAAGAPGSAPGAAGAPPLRAPRERVEYHVRQADELAAHFDEVRQRDCPHFATPDEWRAYLDGEVDRLVLLVAHLEQAWVEAKKTGDDDVRRTAKAPRRRLAEARPLLEKFEACARDNGDALAPLPLWARIQREVPRRQAEIALPE